MDAEVDVVHRVRINKILRLIGGRKTVHGPDGGHGEGGGHGGGEGGGRPHEFYQPKTPEEIGIAAEWGRLQQQKAEAEAHLRSLAGQRPDLERYIAGMQGLARARIRTWRVSAPTPYGESYAELRKTIAKLDRLDPRDPQIDIIRREHPGAYQLWQFQHTRGMKLRNLFWSMSLKRGIGGVAKIWEALTKPFGPLGRLLNWPVKITTGLLIHQLREVPTGPFELANPDSEQFAVREKGLTSERYLGHKGAELDRFVADATRKLNEATEGMNRLAAAHEWVHRLPHAGGH